MTHPKLQYVGTKRICAVAMTRQAYNDLRGWPLPAEENGADEGFLVEYLDGGKQGGGVAGYVSWSPKDIFERAYRPIVTTWEGDDGLNELEAAIQTGKADAPRVMPDKLRGLIAEALFIQPTGTLMICVLTLKNGFTVTGKSACASPENFRENIGRLVSYKNAINELWPLEGYLLKQRMYEQTQAQVPASQGGLNPN